MKLGLQVCDQAGRVNGIIPTPNVRCSHLTFGAPNFDVLYVTAGEKVKGTNHYQSPQKPAMPKL